MQALPSFECSSEIVSTGTLTGRLVLDRGETASIRGDRLFDFAGGVIFQPDAQLPCSEWVSDIGFREGSG